MENKCDEGRNCLCPQIENERNSNLELYRIVVMLLIVAHHYAIDYYWLYVIGCVVAIYCICTIIDIIRIKTIEKPTLNITEKLCNKAYDRFIKKGFFNR